MWITIEAERILYVDRGRHLILCDRLPEAGTLLLKVSAEQLAKFNGVDAVSLSSSSAIAQERDEGRE